jgi:hypothetical protein
MAYGVLQGNEKYLVHKRRGEGPTLAVTWFNMEDLVKNMEGTNYKNLFLYSYFLLVNYNISKMFKFLICDIIMMMLE